jgi:hypothetical protein
MIAFTSSGRGQLCLPFWSGGLSEGRTAAAPSTSCVCFIHKRNPAVRLHVEHDDHAFSTFHIAGGWDKKLKYWDLRTQAAIGEVTLEEKVCAMDTRERLLVVGTADQPPPTPNTLQPQADRMRKIWIFDLSNPTTPWKIDASPLQYQTRCLAAYPDNTGYLVGSIEGRVGVQNFENHPEKQPSYTFKCQRRQLDSTGQVVQAKVCSCMLWCRPWQVHFLAGIVCI